jgi:hypothetical protein
MLFEKKYGEGDVVTLKIVSGEEVIGRFVKEDMMSITLSKPLTIGMTPKGPGMAPVLMTVDPDATLSFNKQAIIIVTPCYKEIADQYVYQTTGIQPVSASSIMAG